MLWTTREARIVWESPDKSKTIWDVIDDNGATQQTLDKAVSTIGFSGEVEEYTSKKGKLYIRVSQSTTQHRADPVKQASIERQSMLKTAVEASKILYAQNPVQSDDELVDAVRHLYNEFMKIIKE